MLKLRKAISAFVVTCAFVAGASSVASAARPNVTHKRCGTKYTPACTKPRIKSGKVSCLSLSPYRLPTITFTSNSGIRRIQIKQGGRTIRTISFKGRGRTQYVLQGVIVSSLRLHSGSPVSVRVTDVRGRSTSKTLQISACATAPNIRHVPVSPKCVNTGSHAKLPVVNLTSAAGIRRIQIREGAKTLRTITFKGVGPTSFSLKSLEVSTLGLHSGGHSVSVTVTDVKGRSSNQTLRFSVCVATPVFTG